MGRNSIQGGLPEKKRRAAVALFLLVFVASGLAVAQEGQAQPAGLALPEARQVRTVGRGYPDGEGSALFWIKKRNGDHVLAKLPECAAVAEVTGFDEVFWMPGGVAVGRSAITPQGVPLFLRIPGTGAVRTVNIKERVGIFGLFDIDWKNGKATKMPRNKWPRVEERADSIVVHVPDLPETRKRGTNELLFGEMENRATGEVRQFIQMKDTVTETSRLLYSGPARKPALSGAFFVDDETVMFNLGQTVWRVTVSPGDATQVFPAPDKEK